MTLAEHMRYVRVNEQWLRKYPTVVGEWSLALGTAAWSTCGKLQEHEVYKIFGCLQAEAYQSASHGSFFWNWTERPDTLEWNFQETSSKGILTGPLHPMPQWDGTGEDPLEGILNPAPATGPLICLGDAVCLRTFYGRYVDVEGCTVSARWNDKGDWQTLRFLAASAIRRNSPTKTCQRIPIVDGLAVCIQDSAGRFLCLQNNGKIKASRRVSMDRAEFTLHLHSATATEKAFNLNHRGCLYLKHKATNRLMDADDTKEGLFARWTNRGSWQRFAVEKLPGDAADALGTPSRKRPQRDPAQASSLKRRRMSRKQKQKPHSAGSKKMIRRRRGGAAAVRRRVLK
jgi:hypothetical protein